MNSAMQSLGFSCNPSLVNGRGYDGAPFAKDGGIHEYTCFHYEAYNSGGDGTSECSSNLYSGHQPLCFCVEPGTNHHTKICPSPSSCAAGKHSASGLDLAGGGACQACEAGKWSKPSSTSCTLFSVGITVKLPYTKAEFDAAKQAAFRAAVASAAGVSTTDVVIVSIKETLRRSGSIDVETNIIAADSAGAGTVSTTLGSGDALKGKLTASLEAEGLQAPTGVTDPTGTSNKCPPGQYRRSVSAHTHTHTHTLHSHRLYRWEIQQRRRQLRCVPLGHVQERIGRSSLCDVSCQ